jgi:hypothetical protein
MKILYVNHNQLNPGKTPEFDINEQEFDLCVVNRYPEHLKSSIKSKYSYKRNYTSPKDGEEWAKGNCVIFDKAPEDIQFSNYNFFVEGANENQCKVWQKLCYKNYNIISGFTSYPSDLSKTHDPGNDVNKFIFQQQAKEILDMVDDRTLLCTDFHVEDNQLIDYNINLIGNGMINHLAEIPAYTVPSIQERQTLRSIDKIITTKNSRIEVSNIKVIKYSSTRKFGHWPITFNINETI